MSPGLQNCQNHCFHDDTCVSYNLGIVEGEIRSCELNDFDHVAFPNDVVDNEGSEYCPIKHICSSGPCPNGTFCVPDFNFDTFKCYDGLWSSWGPWCMCPTTRSRVRVCRNPLTNTSATCKPGHNREDSDNKPYQKIPKDCLDASKCGCRESGVYRFPDNDGHRETKLYCDQETAGGGWTVIQKRKDGSVDFYRGWQDYKNGFGDLDGEFWLGLDKIHQLTNQTRNRLRVDLEDDFAAYEYFAVDDEASEYMLGLGNFIGGTAGDSLTYHAGSKFSTKDRDNDKYDSSSCAVRYSGGWWYTNCLSSNLNGLYLNGTHESYGDGIIWNRWKGFHYSAKTADMKIRPT